MNAHQFMHEPEKTETVETELQRIAEERHKLEQRLNASRIALDRALHAMSPSGPHLSVAETFAGPDYKQTQTWKPRSPSIGRVAAIIVALTVAGLGVTVGPQWSSRLVGVWRRAAASVRSAMSTASNSSTSSTGSTSSPTGSASSATGSPTRSTSSRATQQPSTTRPGDRNLPDATPGIARLLVHVRAQRACWVGIAVDNEEPVGRQLKNGDELILQPRKELLLQADDAGALAVLVNGKPIRLGRDGQAVTVRINSETLSQLFSDEP